ncbi:MAG TPA: family 20 glycosylhydrolase [Fimbriimonas sp.]
MQLRMWTYDLAREQAPSLDHLRRLMDLTAASGYNAIGLYLEHRFAYPSAPWAHGTGCVTPEMVQRLQQEFPDLQIIPCINLLGHMEGFLYSEGGYRFAEERFRGMQADPTNEAFLDLAYALLRDTIEIFASDLIHIGGDETWQLGVGEGSRKKVAEYEVLGPPPPAPSSKTNHLEEGVDGKAMLYGTHFGPLARRVVEAGRTPAVWGDMFFDHPQALDHMPRETVIFDWQYFRSPEFTSRRFVEAGHRVVFCPAIHTYNAVWCHLPQSERNVRQHAEAAMRLGADGVCVTTWEMGLFGNYETMLPAIRASGRILSEATAGDPAANDHEAAWDPKGQGGAEAIARYREAKDAPEFLKAYLEEGEAQEEWARLMGIELQAAGGQFAFGGIRSALKCRLLLYSNPFLLWLRHRDELCGAEGDRALEIAEGSMAFDQDSSTKGISQFLRKSIEACRYMENAHQAYARGEVGTCLTALAPLRQVFDDLEKVAVATNLNIGGSLADVERCRAAKEHVERVVRRVRQYGDGSLGYLPSFEYLTHPKFMPHDQAAWWLINRWANE